MEGSQGTPIMLVSRAPQQGSAKGSGSSLSGMVSTLVPTIAIFIVGFIAFLILRKSIQRVYRPRTNLGSLRDSEKSPKHASGLFGWTKQYSQLPDDFVLGHSSLDNFLWLRFFKILAIMCAVGSLITAPVLMPVYATAGGGQSGLDLISFSNIGSSSLRLYAAALVAWVFLGFVMLLIRRETMFFINLQQAYSLSPFNTTRISARTVIFMDVPKEYRDEAKIRSLFPDVVHVWKSYKPDDLQDLVDERLDDINKLEGAECKAISRYIKKTSKKNSSEKQENGRESTQSTQAPRWDADPKDRPTHKLKPLIGKKVDTIEWSRNEIHRLNEEIAPQQQAYMDSKQEAESAIFVEFSSVRAAQAAFQGTGSSAPKDLKAHAIGTAPDMVLWKNITKSKWTRKLFSFLSTAFMTWLCIFWAIPVAFIGAISNITYLEKQLPWLSFLNAIPHKILGVVTGLLPVVLLSVLMSLVPIIAFLLAKSFCPTVAEANLKVQSWYFGFQVIQVFLVTTFASGAASVVQEIIKQPMMAPQLLATSLPKASNFYISYFILQGLMVSIMQLLNVMPLLMATLGLLIDKTPRKKLNRYNALASIKWGQMYPVITNLGVIALAYSCIAPLVLCFAAVGFSIMYFAFRYQVLFTLGLDADTKGAAYGRALQQLTVGVYLSEFCLIGLFAISVKGSLMSIGPLALMVILLIATIIFHIMMRRSAKKSANHLPEDLLAQEYRFNDEEAGGQVNKEYNNDANTKAINGPNGTNEHHNGDLAPLRSEDSDKTAAYQVPSSASQPERAGLLKRVLHPRKYDCPAALSNHFLSPHLSQPVPPYTAMERITAYMHPAVTTQCSTVWLARDEYGISRREVQGIEEAGVRASDDMAWFNEKGKVEWDEQALIRAPIWEGRPIY